MSYFYFERIIARWCYIKRFSGIASSRVFSVDRFSLISSDSAIFLLNVWFWKLLAILLRWIGEKTNTTFTDSICSWRRYVDDTFVFVIKGCVEHVLVGLNYFHQNIQFTYDLESQNKLSFRDILLIWRWTKIETTVYRKSANNDIYLNWNSFAPVTWRRGTLKTLVNRACIVCSTDYHLKKELDHSRYGFLKHNNYPKRIIKQVAKQVRYPNIHSNKALDKTHIVANYLATNFKSHTLLLLYNGQKGEHLVRSLRKDMHRLLPKNVMLALNLVPNLITSKVRLTNPTTRYSLLCCVFRTRLCRRLHWWNC